MRLVEQHVIERGDPRWRRIDAAAFASKNLWNLANYWVRQAFIHEHPDLDNTALSHLVKASAASKALPAKVSNQVLIQLHQAWIGFFEAMNEWRSHPEHFTGRWQLQHW
jgi:putative transposase